MLNFLTFNQLDYQCLKLAGNLTDDAIHAAIRRNYINTKLMKIYGFLDGTNDPFYNRSITFSSLVTAAQEFLKDTVNSGGTITSINATTKTVVRSAGSFTVGSVLNISYTDSGGTLLYQMVAVVTSTASAGLSAVYSVISGSIITMTSGHVVSMIVQKMLFGTTKTIDVSNLYFKNFSVIYDNERVVAGTDIRVFDEIKDPAVFFKRAIDFNALKRVAWYQQGDNILLYVSSSANPLGTVIGDYRGMPAIFTSSNGESLMDFPPILNQALIDEVAASYLTEVGNPVPADIQSRLASYEAKFSSSASTSKAIVAEKLNK